MQSFLRYCISAVASKTPWYWHLCDRALTTEIGFSGNVSLVDESIAKDKGHKPLNRFEKWLLGPSILQAKAIRQNAFREACIEVLGEDPN